LADNADAAESTPPVSRVSARRTAERRPTCVKTDH
jgi:hypothetical protein